MLSIKLCEFSKERAGVVIFEKNPCALHFHKTYCSEHYFAILIGQCYHHHLYRIAKLLRVRSEIAYKVSEQPFCSFKSVIKYKIISSYNNTCIDPENCVSCKRGNIDSVEGI